MSQLARVSSILRLFERNQFVSRKQLLALTETSLSTLKRDLEHIRSWNRHDIQWDPQKQAYHAPSLWLRPDRENRIDFDRNDGYGLPSHWFQTNELHSLLVVSHFLKSLGADFLENSLDPFFQKVRLWKPTSKREWREILLRVRLFRPMGRPFNSGILLKVSRSLLDRRRLRVLYRSKSTDEAISREISPQRLVYYRDNWYLDAWCHLRKELRSFSVDGFEEIQSLKKKAKEIEDEVLDRELGSGYGIFSGSRTRKAVLRFTPYRARWIQKETWHPEQKSSFRDGLYYLEIPYTDDRELVLDILRYGPDVEVLDPPELREKIAENHRRAAKLYENKG